MSSEKQQRQLKYEKLWAEALFEKLNHKEGTDYIATEPLLSKNSNMPDVDIEGVSQSGEFPCLYLQLTSDNRRDLDSKMHSDDLVVFNANNILQAIEDKYKKYTKANKNMSQIILVIQGTMSERDRPYELTPELFAECKKYPFNKIYYISAPCVSNSSGTNHYQDWFVERLA